MKQARRHNRRWLVLGLMTLGLIAFFSLQHRAKIQTEFELPDFDAALQGVNFDPTSDHNGAEGENGIPEGDEMALVAAILADPTLDLSARGGVQHQAVKLAYQQALQSARADVGMLSVMWPSTAQVVVGYSMLGKDSHAAIRRMTASFGADLQSDYSLALAQENYLGAQGDADGDGYSNQQEYYANQQRDAYVQAALNPAVHPSEEALKNMPKPKKTRYTVGIVLYPGFEVLDVYGPLEMWAYAPGFEIVMIGEKAGPVRSAQGAETVATHSFSSAPKLDILMVPGGFGTQTELNNPALLDYIVKANEQTLYTTSVCTGSALLAKAGVLDGHSATANKRFFSLSESQSDAVEWVPEARWVESGKMFTSSGVSAGTDMALGLVAKMFGKMAATQLASAVEYVWHEDADNDPFVEYLDRQPRSGEVEYALLKSLPAAGARLDTAPSYIRLYFSRLPALDDAKLSLQRVGGDEQSYSLSGLHSMGANDLMFAVDGELVAGNYRLDWAVSLGEQRHALSGQLDFSVVAN